jgi:hypothetical protein
VEGLVLPESELAAIVEEVGLIEVVDVEGLVFPGPEPPASIEEISLINVADDDGLEASPGKFMVCPICKLSQSIPGFAALRSSKVHPSLSAIAQPKSPATTM